MSKSKWRRKLLTILSAVGDLFKRQKKRKQRAIATRNSRIKPIRINKRGIFWAALSFALVVLVAGSVVSKAGAIFPQSISKVGRQPNGSVLVNTGQSAYPCG